MLDKVKGALVELLGWNARRHYNMSHPPKTKKKHKTMHIRRVFILISILIVGKTIIMSLLLFLLKINFRI